MNYKSTRKLKDGRKIIISGAKSSDAIELTSVANKVRAESKYLSLGENDPPMSVEKEIKFIEDMNKASYPSFIVAKLDGKIAGYGMIAIGKNLRNKHRAVLGIATLKEFWGLGIGRKIMDVLMVCAKKLNLEQIFLSVVYENIRAIKLYKDFGFITTGMSEKAMKYEDGTYADFINMVKFL